MRGGPLTIALGLTALIAYSIGRHDVAPAVPKPSAVIVAPSTTKPVAFVDTTATIKTQPAPALPTPPTKSSQPNGVPSQLDTKRKAEVLLTAAAIIAILIQASRDQYHATGHPCACPDDLMRNGRRCGGNSAHSRAGGAAPLCSATDITAEMIEAYRKTTTR